MGEADENSDIDLFIITKRGQLWTGRFFVTILSSLMGIKRQTTRSLTKGSIQYLKKTKNKFCLSFFITEDATNLESIRLTPDDPYLDKWIKTLTPLINKNTTLEQFWEENKKIPVGHSSVGIRHTVFETLVKKLWLPHSMKTYESLGRPWGVVISDTMLKFHDNDQRKIYRDTLRKE